MAQLAARCARGAPGTAVRRMRRARAAPPPRAIQQAQRPPPPPQPPSSPPSPSPAAASPTPAAAAPPPRAARARGGAPPSSSSRGAEAPDLASRLASMRLGDSGKEYERRFRRTVFTPQRWAAHRSTQRYLRHVSGILNSRTFRGLAPPLAFISLVAAWVCVYHQWLEPLGAPIFRFGDLPLNITAFALSLLLVFRTDTSYARWAHALQTWDEVRSNCKDIARLACYWVRDRSRKEMLVRWTAAYSHALLAHVRHDAPLERQLSLVLLPHEVAAALAARPNATSFTLQVISELIEQCHLGDVKEDKMMASVRILADAVGKCDCLLRYPVPLGYTRHTSRFLLLWLTFLPFAIWPQCGWASLPITTGIAYLLLGIEDIGVQIEEPFSVLPLEDVVDDIQQDIATMLLRQDVVTDLLQASGLSCDPRSSFDAGDWEPTIPRAAVRSSSPSGALPNAAPPPQPEQQQQPSLLQWPHTVTLMSMDDEAPASFDPSSYNPPPSYEEEDDDYEDEAVEGDAGAGGEAGAGVGAGGVLGSGGAGAAFPPRRRRKGERARVPALTSGSGGRARRAEGRARACGLGRAERGARARARDSVCGVASRVVGAWTAVRRRDALFWTAVCVCCAA